jgi:hypothetical protein
MMSLLRVVMHVSNRIEDLLDMFCLSGRFGITVIIFIMLWLYCKLRLCVVGRCAIGILCSPFFYTIFLLWILFY